jgi:ATP-dependent Clp protease ATP-binding subunit ClpB
VRRKPYSVILLDEIEKAHPDVFNVLLQVLDDGRLTDNKGRVVNFKNTIIIMTSNTGSHVIQENFAKASEADFTRVFERTRHEVMELLRQEVRPEFLNRIDEIIMFTPLSRNEITGIVRLQLNRLADRLKSAGLHMVASKEAVHYLGEAGFDQQFGARPVKRVIQKEVLNELSKALLSNSIDRNETVVLDVFDGKVVFRKQLEAEEVVEFMA